MERNDKMGKREVPGYRGDVSGVWMDKRSVVLALQLPVFHDPFHRWSRLIFSGSHFPFLAFIRGLICHLFSCCHVIPSFIIGRGREHSPGTSSVFLFTFPPTNILMLW